MVESFQKAIEDLTQEEAQAELRRAWDMWREMDDLCDQARDWAIAANSLRDAALEALEEDRETLQSWEEGTHPAIVEAQAKIEELSRQVAEAVWIEDLRQREERAEGRDIGCCAGRVPVLVEALEEAQERAHDLEEGMTATGLGLVKDKRDLKRKLREAQGKRDEADDAAGLF